MTTSAVSVSEFKARCLDLIRQVEKAGTPLNLVRHGKVVARLVPTVTAGKGTPTWLRLRGLGKLEADPDESVLVDTDFDAVSGVRG